MSGNYELAGRRIGRWTVLVRADEAVRANGSRQSRWLCRCDCGTETPVLQNSLVTGKSLQCSRRSWHPGRPEFPAAVDLLLDQSLAIKRPDLAQEWHTTKNNGLLPTQVRVSSNKRVWWKCDAGADHEWRTSVGARSGGSGCPFCENRRIGATNSLAAVNPELAREWHPTKNGPLTPYDVPPSGAKGVWWKCPAGDDHEWKMSVNARASGSKSGCPFCDGKRVSKGNSLEAKHPVLAKEWHPSKNGSLLPSQVTARSGKIAWWVCDRKHDYRARVADRVAGRRCGKCRNQTSHFELRLLAELESLFEQGQVLHRHKVGGVECDLFLVPLLLAIEVDGGHWHRAREPEDRRKNSVLEAEGMSCLRVRGPGLSTIGPHDVMVTKGEENNPNHEVISRVVEAIALLTSDTSLQILVRQYKESTGFRNPQRFNKLMWDIAKPAKGAALSDRAPPELLAEWHPTLNQPLEPEDLSYGSGRKVWWLCAAKGHAWPASVDNRMKGNGCHQCYKGRGRSKSRASAAG